MDKKFLEGKCKRKQMIVRMVTVSLFHINAQYIQYILINKILKIH